MGQRSTLAKTLEKIARFVQNINYRTPVSNAGVKMPTLPTPQPSQPEQPKVEPSQPTLEPSNNKGPFDYNFDRNAPYYSITDQVRLNWDAVDFDKFRNSFTRYWTANGFGKPSSWNQLPTSETWLNNNDFWDAVKSSKTYGDLNNVLQSLWQPERIAFVDAVARAHFPTQQYNGKYVFWSKPSAQSYAGYKPFSQFYFYNPARHASS